MTQSLDLSRFRQRLPIQLRWGDMDALGHVNNANFLTYLELARIQYFNTLALWDGSTSETGVIMAKVVIDYKLPLVWTDTIEVYTRVNRFGTRSFDTQHVVVRHVDGDEQIAALAVVTLVVYDYQAAQSVVIPQVWRDKLIAYEPGDITS